MRWCFIEYANVTKKKITPINISYKNRTFFFKNHFPKSCFISTVFFQQSPLCIIFVFYTNFRTAAYLKKFQLRLSLQNFFLTVNFIDIRCVRSSLHLQLLNTSLISYMLLKNILAIIPYNKELKINIKISLQLSN